MSSRHDEPHDDRAEFEQARAEFLASVTGRVEGLTEALHSLQDKRDSQRRRDNFLRRVHALGAAARVLGFEKLAEELGGIERGLRGVRGVPPPERLAQVEQILTGLPGLVLQSTSSPAPETGSEQASTPALAIGPATVLVYGTQAFVSALRAEETGRIEIARAEDLPTARDLAQSVGPDLAIVDGDLRGARELVRALLGNTLADPVAVIVAGNFETPDAASDFVEMGVARVLSKPVSPESLVRIVASVVARPPERFGIDPIGEVAMTELTDRIATEVQRGLVQALEPGCEERKAPLGTGTDVLAAVWGALARVRELVTVTSGGAIRFDLRGPEGAFTLAPWVGRERIASDRKAGPYRGAEDVPLKGRRAVVIDDDPAVVWFIGGLLSGVGFEVLEAHDGERGFELVCSAWPDVVVSDVLMPGRDGFTLCRDIKQDVAVRDTPVILLSWKEDLLRRVRELGAEADGYLQKEAPASAVVARVREVLLPRARVEARLVRQGQARGRLDGLTPRLLLELVAARCSDARVSIRDAIYAYEAEIRDGRLRCATRTDAQGRFLRGDGALAGLLGVGSGRFVVSPTREPSRNDFEGDLKTVLAPPIRAARAAARALADEQLPRVARIDFDTDAVAAYAALLPDPAKSVAVRLLGGALPRDLLGSEKLSSRLLRAVLADFARHGGIRAIESDDGDDLLAQFAAVQEPSAIAPADVPETRTPSPWFSLQLSPGPAEPVEAAAPERQPAEPPQPEQEQLGTPAGSPQPAAAEVPPVAPNEPGERVSLLDRGWEEGGAQVAPGEATDLADRVTLPGVGSGRKAKAETASAAAVDHAGAQPPPVDREVAQDEAPMEEAAEPLDSGWGDVERLAAPPPPPADSPDAASPEPEPTSAAPALSAEVAAGGAEPPGSALEPAAPSAEPGASEAERAGSGTEAEATGVGTSDAGAAQGTATELANALLGAMADGHAFYPDSQLQPRRGVVQDTRDSGDASVGVAPHAADAPAKTSEQREPVDVESEPLVVRRVARPPRPDPNEKPPPAPPDTNQDEANAADLPPPSGPVVSWEADQPEPPPANEESPAERQDDGSAPAGVEPPPASADLSSVSPNAAGSDEEEQDDSARSSGPDLRWEVDQPPAPESRERPSPERHAQASPPGETSAEQSPRQASSSERGADAPAPMHEPAVPTPSEESPVFQSAPAASETAMSGSPAQLPATKRIAFPVAERTASSEEAAVPGASETPATKHIVFPTRSSNARSEALDEVESPDAPAVQRSEPPRARGQHSERRGGSRGSLLSAARTAGLTVAAAAASFALVSVVRGWLAPGEGEAPAEVAASAEMAPAAAASVTAPVPAGSATAKKAPAEAQKRAFKTEDLPLPPGIVVSAARGLLEVDSGGRHSIYVGGTFVGRGPIRRITLDPGPHPVRIRLGAEEIEHTVTVTKGRRLRLSLAPSK